MMKGYLKQVANFSKAVFDGFVLKPGYFYGENDVGQPIATSTCVKDGKLCLYTKNDGKWTADWIPVAEAAAKYPALLTSLSINCV